MDFTTADLHMCPRDRDHYANITLYTSRPDAWDELIIRNWNATVSPGDTVVVLGDFAWKADHAAEILRILNGRKILVLGNHDGSRSQMLSAGFDEVHGTKKGRTYSNPEKGRTQFWMPYDTGDGGRVALSHAPMPELPDGCSLNYHGHVHNSPYASRPWHRNVSVEVTGYSPVPLVSG